MYTDGVRGWVASMEPHLDWAVKLDIAAMEFAAICLAPSMEPHLDWAVKPVADYCLGDVAILQWSRTSIGR